MASIVKNENGDAVNKGAAILASAGFPGSHALTKELGGQIFAAWPVNNDGETEGYALVRLVISQLGYTAQGNRFLVPPGGSTSIANNFAPPWPDTPVDVNFSCVLILDETDINGAFIRVIDSHAFSVFVAAGQPAGPMLFSAGTPSIS